MTTSIADMITLRDAAMETIAEAWGVLAAENVVPCSGYRPFIEVGRDYEGGILSGRPAFARFTTALRQQFPAWFEAAPGQSPSPRWSPEVLAFEFVDATIGELTRRGETGDSAPAMRSRLFSWSLSTTSTARTVSSLVRAASLT